MGRMPSRGLEGNGTTSVNGSVEQRLLQKMHVDDGDDDEDVASCGPNEGLCAQRVEHGSGSPQVSV